MVSIAKRIIRMILFVAFCAAAPFAAAAPVLDSANSTSLGTTTSATFSHTTIGTNTFAILCIGFQANPLPTTITHTYGGVNMPLVSSVGTPAGLLMYQLVNPTTGSNLVELEWDTFVDRGVAGIVTFTGVNQAVPLGTPATNSIDDSGPATVTVASALNDLVIDCVYANDVMNITVGGGQTVVWEIDPGSAVPGGSSTKPGASSSTVMSWTLSQGTEWKIIGVAIKPVTIAAPTRRMGPMVIP